MLKKFLIILAIALGVVLVLCWIYLPSISRYHELKQEEEKLGKRIREIDVQIKTLADEKYLLQNDLIYLEKVIREELGFVKPGEIIYEMVTKKNAGISAVPATVGETAVRTPAPVISSTVKTGIKKATTPSATVNSATRKIRSPAGKATTTKRRPSQT